MKQKNEWISIHKSFPKVFHHVLIANMCNGTVSMGYLRKKRPEKKWEILDKEIEDFAITHWMPLPDAPKFDITMTAMLPAPILQYVNSRFK